MSENGSIKGRLEFNIRNIKKNGHPNDLARPAVEGLKAPGVLRKVGVVVEGASSAVNASNAASDDLQAVETVVSPFVENLKIFADVMTEFSTV